MAVAYCTYHLGGLPDLQDHGNSVPSSKPVCASPCSPGGQRPGRGASVTPRRTAPRCTPGIALSPHQRWSHASVCFLLVSILAAADLLKSLVWGEIELAQKQVVFTKSHISCENRLISWPKHSRSPTFTRSSGRSAGAQAPGTAGRWPVQETRHVPREVACAAAVHLDALQAPGPVGACCQAVVRTPESQQQKQTSSRHRHTGPGSQDPVAGQVHGQKSDGLAPLHRHVHALPPPGLSTRPHRLCSQRAGDTGDRWERAAPAGTRQRGCPLP